MRANVLQEETPEPAKAGSREPTRGDTRGDLDSDRPLLRPSARVEAHSQVQRLPRGQNQDLSGVPGQRRRVPGPGPAQSPSPVCPGRGQRVATASGRGAAEPEVSHSLSAASPREPGQRAARGGRAARLPRPAPAVSTLAMGSNPERLSRASRNSDILAARAGSPRCRLLGGARGPVALARAGGPAWSAVICKRRRESLGSAGPASPPRPPGAGRGRCRDARVPCGERVSASEPPRVWTSPRRVRLVLHHARGAEDARGSPPLSTAAAARPRRAHGSPLPLGKRRWAQQEDTPRTGTPPITIVSVSLKGK